MAINKATQRTRENIAKRLNEVMKEKHIKPEYLRRHSGVYMSRQTLYYIRNAQRPLDPEDAKALSKVLRIDPGYLLGLDDYKANSYDEYLQMMKDEEEYQQDLAGFSKYDYLINLIKGYLIVGASEIGTEFTDYTYLGNNVYDEEKNVTMSGIVATIPAADMETFEREVLKEIKKRFDKLMLKHRNEAEEKRMKLNKYSLMHHRRRK